jgi:hypothetical protein
MKEEFLHYLWKYRLLKSPLLTTKGENIEVIRTGVHNTDSGPDFIDARLKIGTTLWAGNVEIHLRSSSWFEHKHEQDNAYDNVILHVVLTDDEPAVRTSGDEIPCLECSNLIPENLYEKYKDLMSSKLWIPCARIIKFCPSITVQSWLENQLVEKLERKAQAINEIWLALNHDWEEVFYRLLARSFGLKINALPFEILAASLPHKILSRHQDQEIQIEALLFGQAGFLNEDFNDSYPSRLGKEYDFLRNKYNLEALDASVWKFLRLRPTAFPTIRIAQFAALMQKSPALFSLVLETENINDLRNLFMGKASSYWDDHYRFDKKSTDKKSKVIGDQSIDLMIINAVVPIIFLYGKIHQNEELKSRALNLLEKLPPEKNATISKWQSIGILVKDAFSSQALLNLKQNYCDKKRCLDCRIGNELLK